MLPAERFARVWIIALIAVFTLYFGVLQILIAEQVELDFFRRIALLGAALGALGVIAAAAWGWLRMRRGDDDAPDERDREIDRRATQIAYYVLMAGFIYVGCILPFEARDSWEVVHEALVMIAIAEIVQAGLVIHYYRRGLRA